MKIKFPFCRNTVQYQTINQAYRSMEQATNPRHYYSTPHNEYIQRVNQATKNTNIFTKIYKTLKIMLQK